MAIGLTAEHEELAGTVRRWMETHCRPGTARAAMEGDPGSLPPGWGKLAEQGWLGLHIDQEHGGEGFTVAELCVVLAELAGGLMPGPVLPTVVVSGAITRYGSTEGAGSLLPELVDGRSPAGVYLGEGGLESAEEAGGAVRVWGRLGPVLGAPTARWLLLPVGAEGWCVVEAGEEAKVEPVAALDGTRPLGTVVVDSVVVPATRRLVGVGRREVQDLGLVLSAAEAAGVARWALGTASEYSKVRVQFGRPIGQFQAVKHKVADMLVGVEQIEAVAWDAAQAFSADPAGKRTGPDEELAAGIAGGIALDAAVECAKTCVQVLGGIGFTWEHDAHLYLRRATATRLLLGEGGGPGGGPLHHRVAALAVEGARRPLVADLPPEAAELREGVDEAVKEVAGATGEEQRRRLVATGLLMPHWPRPWGRDASALEQLVIDEALGEAGVVRPGLAVGAWALPTLIAHGTTEQQERWVGPTLEGKITWCQLFSEPGAGSDLASLTTRAERVEGGWRLEGQKVWTSMAQTADWGICLARSDPGAPKHEGITYFVVDMRSEGVEVRPLRELTGDALFNEVFLDGVFVPDDCVVGEPGGGWAIGRTTLANERVSLSSGATFGIGIESVLRRVEHLGRPEGGGVPAGVMEQVGRLLAEAQSLRLMGHRATLRSLSGTDPGAGASVRKLLAAEHEQRVQELGLALLGGDGAVMDGPGQRWAHGFLVTRCLTIAGGTSEVQRNVMAERLLGLPRDPEPAR